MGGRYHCKVDGFEVVSGAVNTTTYQINPQLISLSSSRFVFPGGIGALQFTNTGINSLADLGGHRYFEMDIPSGNIDLTMTIAQYGTNINSNVAAVASPYTQDKTATWTSANFAYAVLWLSVEQEDSKALFGTMKGHLLPAAQ
jgi:hypothetical protein